MCLCFLAIGFSNIGLWASAMQLKFLSYVRVSSSGLFTASIDEISINTSENYKFFFPIFLFWQSFVLCAVYRNSCCWKDVKGECWCICSMKALRKRESFSDCPKTVKRIDFFERHTCLSPGQIYLRQKKENWLQLLFYFPVLMSIVTSFTAMSFSTVLGSRLKFSRNALLRKPIQLVSETDMITNG